MNRRSTLHGVLSACALACAAAFLFGCPKPGPRPEAELQRRVLRATGEGVIVPVLEGFVADAQALETATAAYATASASGPATAELDAARAAFRAAFLRWQLAEVLQVGPAGLPGRVTAGQGLRDAIYSWPLSNLCRLDTHLVDKAWEAPGFLDTALVTSKGLFALEQLLFSTSSANRCDAAAAINTSGSWAALSADELARRRADYARAAAAQLAGAAAGLRDAWSGGFLETFATAGTSGNAFPSSQEAVDQLFGALFYVDLMTKDAKVGGPAGMTDTCPTPCPGQAEAILSGLSREAVVKNLEAARALVRGGLSGSGNGFDALLEARGAADVAASSVAALDDAIASVATLSAPVDQAAVSQLADLQAVRGKLKVFTDLLKGQLSATLNLRIPQEGAGDSD